jgi:putative sigma-54 modulation protein
VDVRVHGKNMQVDDATRSLADEKVRHAGRILDDGGTADVEFSERSNPRQSDGRYRVEITSHTRGHTVRVEASSIDDRAALDLAVDKFERQLRRLKERLIQRSRPAERPNNGGLPSTSSTEPDEEAAGSGRVVRTKTFEMRPMSVEEAALQMDLLGHSFFFFLDAESGKQCVLYHRADGSLGLIEPS